MTDPTQARQVRTGGNRTTRRYSWPPFPPHEFTVTSVTLAIKGGMPTPHLIGWAAKVTAEAAVNDHDIVGAMLAKGDKLAAIQHIKGSRFRDMQAKAERGTIVHAAVDAYLAGKPFTKAEIRKRLLEAHVPENIWESTSAMIAGVMEFLWDSEIEIFHNEATLYNRTHQYAGTADLIGRYVVGGALNYGVVDVKTSKAIYNEVALQLVAYANAEFVGLQDGTEAPLTGSNLDGPIQYGTVVRPKADGSYERQDFTLGEDVFKMFLACLGVTEGTDNNVLAEARGLTYGKKG